MRNVVIVDSVRTGLAKSLEGVLIKLELTI